MDSGAGHADIAGAENSWQTGFESSGSPFVFAPCWRVSDVCAGFDEAFLVALDPRRQPLGAWASTDRGKYSRRLDRATFPCARVFQFDLLELLVAEHFFRDVIATNHEQHFCGAIGKKHGRLSGRVATAGDDHRFVSTNLTFKCCGRVVDTDAFEPFAILGLESAIVGTGRNQNSSRA